VFTSESSKMRSIENQLAEQQKQSWVMLVAGMTLGFIGLHFMMARPLVRQIERMQTELTQVEQRMKDLVGVRDEVWEANSLLSSLKAQQAQITDARTALQAIREQIETGNEIDRQLVDSFNRFSMMIDRLQLANQHAVDALQQVRDSYMASAMQMQEWIERSRHRNRWILGLSFVMSLLALTAVGVLFYMLTQPAHTSSIPRRACSCRPTNIAPSRSTKKPGTATTACA